MDKMLFALSLGFAGLIFATQAALAAQCAPRDQVVAGLATGFDEVRRGAGLTAGPDGRAQVAGGRDFHLGLGQLDDCRHKARWPDLPGRLGSGLGGHH